MSFSENLAVLMKKKYETMYRLAKDINVSQTTISNWLTGKSEPQLKLLGRLAEHYGTTVEDLMK